MRSPREEGLTQKRRGLSWAWGIPTGGRCGDEKDPEKETEKEQPVRSQENQQGDKQGLGGGREMPR